MALQSSKLPLKSGADPLPIVSKILHSNRETLMSDKMTLMSSSDTLASGNATFVTNNPVGIEPE